jgi:selenide,water dikinase
VLSGITLPHDNRVLVDFRTADDAGVYRLDDRTALVQTVDFFTPVVDDPFEFGSIAAANALSDVYAMGGTPISALAVAAMPRTGLGPDDIREIFRGGLETLKDAGVALLGGHTVQDVEVKFGYAVTGLVVPGRHWTNAGALAGDTLILTKPLGTGIISTALKHGQAPALVVRSAVESMRMLNRAAADVLRAAPDGVVHGCTDVTGFALLGHACEMALASGVRLRIRLSAVPVLDGTRDLAVRYRPGGTASNEDHFGQFVTIAPDVDPVARAILYDPQTSGGLLASVSATAADHIVRTMGAAGVSAAVIGTVAAVPRGAAAGVDVA